MPLPPQGFAVRTNALAATNRAGRMIETCAMLGPFRARAIAEILAWATEHCNGRCPSLTFAGRAASIMCVFLMNR